MKPLFLVLLALVTAVAISTEAQALDRTLAPETTLKRRDIAASEVRRRLTPSEREVVECQAEMHTVCCDESGGELDSELFCGWTPPFGSMDAYYQCLLDLCGEPEKELPAVAITY
jgi:hypothetical protein